MIVVPHSWGIRRKVLLLAVFPAATVALSLAVYFSVAQTQDLERSLEDRGLAIVRQLAPASEYGMYSGNRDVLRTLADAVLRESDVRAVVIRNPAGNIVVQAGLTPRPAVLLEARTNVLQTAWSDDRGSRVFQAPIRQAELVVDNLLDDLRSPDGEPSAATPSGRLLGWVTVELSRERTQERQRRIWRNTGFIAFIVLMLGAALAIRMGRRISEPIVALRDAVAEMERGNLDVQVDRATGGELRALETGLNTMARALKASRENLQVQIDQATVELRRALRVLEDRNAELEVARRGAESASRAKSAFLANISHEIRTPLNGILGFLTLLAKTDIGSTQQEYIAKIDASTKTLLTLLNDILDFSRLEVARLKVQAVDFDVRALLDDSAGICVPEAQAKGLELIVFADADVPTRLKGGADRIAQVLKNLVSNAVKFTTRGEVVVQATWITDAQAVPSLRIAVTDTGIGIAPDDRAHLFQPFSQLDAGMSRRYGGAGLGLAIAKSLVELMHGRLSVESTPGQGSCFSFTLPLERCAPLASDEMRTTMLGGRHALVVAPNPRLARALQQTLRHWNMQVEHTQNVAQASTFVYSASQPQAAIDVVIIDAMLGDDEVERILAASRAHGDDRAPGCVLLARVESALGVGRTGAADRISRPARATELGDLLCRVLSGGADRRALGRAGTSAPSAWTRAPLRILLADDNPINREFLATWLHQFGAQVDEVVDGAAAIACCQRARYSLILMDLHMPNVDGLTAAARIRADGDALTPIIAITADATEAAQRGLQESGINDCLIKPVDEPMLMRVLDRWCTRSQPDAAVIAAPQYGTRASIADDVVDMQYGVRLASGNVPLWQGSLRSLAERLPQQQIAVEYAVQMGDARAAREQIHSVRGSAGYCGAMRLLEVASRMESVLIAHDLDAAGRMMPDLRAAVNEFLTWVSESLGPSSPVG